MKFFYKTCIVLLVLTTLLVITVSWVGFENQKESFKTVLLDEISTTVHQKALSMEKFIANKQKKTQLISVFPEAHHDFLNLLSATDYTSIDSSFIQILKTNPDVLHMAILNLDGNELVRYNSLDGKAVKETQENLRDHSDSAYFINAKSTDSLYTTNIELNDEHEHPHPKIITMLNPIKNNFDETVAFLEINYDVSYILKEIYDMKIGNTLIFDQNGNFLLHTDSSKEFGDQLGTNVNYFEDQPEVGKNVHLYDSKQHTDTQSHEFRIWEKVFYDPEDSSRFWVIASIVPDTVLTSYIQELQNDLFPVIIISLMGAIFASIVMSTYITRPLKQILGTVKQIENGHLNVQIDNAYSDEVGELAYSINQMTRSLKQSEILVDDYRKHLESNIREINVLNRALNETLMVIKIDIHGNITYANNKFYYITKYSKNELLGKNYRIIIGNIPDSVYKTLWETLSIGQIWANEINHKKKDGSYFWVYEAIVPNLDDDGKPIEYISLNIDITKRKQVEEKLLLTLKELEEINISKNEFSAMVSHELRTPLTPIITYCDILKESSYRSDLDKECISEIESNAEKLNLLISDMLDAQKLEMDTFKFTYSTFSIPALVEKVIKDLKPTADTKNTKIIMGDISDIMLTSDELRINQVLENLVKNSLDFIPKKSGIIEISATSLDDSVLFHVKDNGIGIPKDKISSLFRKFYTSSSGIKRSHEGTGLGLAICRGIVEGLGGKIWVTSNIGKETIFSFTIPRMKTLMKVQNGSK